MPHYKNVFNFRIQTDDVTIERVTTRYMAVSLAMDASLFTDCEITVDREIPETNAVKQLNLDKWVRIGHASNGTFYQSN